MDRLVASIRRTQPAAPPAPARAATPIIALTIEERLRRIRSVPRAVQARALGEALRLCAPAEAAHIVPVLVQLAADAARPAPRSANSPPHSSGNDDIARLHATYDPSGLHGAAPAIERWLAALRRWWQDGDEPASDAAVRSLAIAWAQVPPALRDLAHSVGRARWADALARAEQSGRWTSDADALGSIALLAGQSRDAALAPWCAAALTLPASADVGERALLTLAWHALGVVDAPAVDALRPIDAPFPTLPAGPRDRARAARALAGALLGALEQYPRHRRRGAALAATLLLDGSVARNSQRSAAIAPADPPPDAPADAPPLASLVAALLDPRDPRGQAMLGALRTSRVALTRARALEWAQWGASRPRLLHALRARLSLAHDAEDHAAVLARAHLCLHPARSVVLAGVIVRGARRATRQVGTVATEPPALRPTRGGALPRPDQLAQLSPAQRRELPRFARAIRVEAPVRLGAIEPLLSDADPLCRMALVRHAGHALLPDLLVDAHPAVAGAAMASWSADHQVRTQGGQSGAAVRAAIDVLAKLRRTPHGVVRALASIEHAGLLAALSPTPAGRAVAWQWLATDRAGLLAFLREAAAQSAQHAMEVMRVAQRLRLCDDLESMLVAMASQKPGDDAARRVVATAASALGRARGTSGQRTLERLLESDDPRVRANSVEALGRRLRSAGPAGWPAHTAARLAACEAPPQHHRVRANALREAWHLGPAARRAGVGLLAMLHDQRDMHRLAGAWLAGRVRASAPVRDPLRGEWPAIVARVQDLSHDDPQPTIRRRAADALRVLAVPSLAPIGGAP